MGSRFKAKADKQQLPVGDIVPHEDWGIIPRALDHLLARVRDLNAAAAGRGQPPLRLSLSYQEIYNEAIYDLLPDGATAPGDPQQDEGVGEPRHLVCVVNCHNDYILTIWYVLCTKFTGYIVSKQLQAIKNVAALRVA